MSTPYPSQVPAGERPPIPATELPPATAEAPTVHRQPASPSSVQPIVVPPEHSTPHVTESLALDQQPDHPALSLPVTSETQPVGAEDRLTALSEAANEGQLTNLEKIFANQVETADD